MQTAIAAYQRTLVLVNATVTAAPSLREPCRGVGGEAPVIFAGS